MAVKIRLRAQGCKNRVMYRLVAADSRAPRDGKYIENLGWYNPFAHNEEQQLNIKPDRIQYWISQGAQVSDKAVCLIKKLAPAIVTEMRAKSQKKHMSVVKERQEHRHHRAELHSKQ